MIGAVLAMRTRAGAAPVRVSGLAAALEGLRFLRRVPILLGVMGVDFVATFFAFSSTLMPIFADRILHVGAGGLGLLLAAPAAGGVAAGFRMAWLPASRRPGLGVLVVVGVYGLCIAGFGLSRHFALSLLLLAASGAADAVSMVYRQTIRTLVTPDELRGRIAALHSIFAQGGPQLGDFEAGAVAAIIGAGGSVFLGGMLTVLAALVVARRVPAIWRYRVDDAPAPAASLARAAAD